MLSVFTIHALQGCDKGAGIAIVRVFFQFLSLDSRSVNGCAHIVYTPSHVYLACRKEPGASMSMSC